MKFILVLIAVIVGVSANIMKKPTLCYFHMKPGNGTDHIARYHYDSWLNKCNQFDYTGSGGNANNFGTEDECMNTCKDVPCNFRPTLCFFSLKEGNGSGNEERYYYDSWLGICEKFNYTGSGGNANNFATEKECLETCNGIYCD